MRAFKGKEGPCYETNKAVVYRGPWRRVVDDDGHVFHRGARAAVCEKTFQLMTREPYATEFDVVLPRVPVDVGGERPFLCQGSTLRHPRETKGVEYDETTEAGPLCDEPDCC
jgi:hypothetical protein